MAFMNLLAYGGPSTWADLCGSQQPWVDGQGFLAPPWGDAIRAAVVFEQQNPAWEQDPQFADGPAGQVIAFLNDSGFGAFEAQANATEEAAKQGFVQMQGGFAPIGHLAGAPVHVPAQQMMHGDLPPHEQCLTKQTKVEVKEKASWIEAFTAIIGAEIEMANKYQVMSDGGSEELFYAVEETDCCTRQAKQCFPDCAPWTLDILYTQNGYQQVVYRLTRPWTCTCLCFNRPSVDVVDVTTNQKIGSISDPFACCNLTFHVRDKNDQEVLLANGGCCQWGLCCPLPCGPCAEVNFPISDVSSGASVGHLQKKVPSCCKFFLAPDVDNYKLDFGGVSHPQWKALLLGLAIFVDFRYFNDNSNDDQGGFLGALTE